MYKYYTIDFTMKKFLNYVLVFIGTITILVVLLLLTSLIPKDKIVNNIEESLPYLSEGREIKYVKKKHPVLWRHIYADEILLNIIYNIDNNNVLDSIMYDRYYYTGFFSLESQLDKKFEPNQQYIRYWHGSMIFVRPLLLIFNIEEIYVFNAVILSILSLILIYILWKKRMKFLIPIFLIAIILTGSIFVPFCLEYYWNFLIMLVVTIIAILIDNKDNNRLYILFCISGIVTCFLDFLSTEEITVLVPLVFILSIRLKQHKVESFKDEFKFIIKSMIIWFLSYSLMWFAKWILASVILHINAFDYVKENALLRINGDLLGMSYGEIILKTLKKNILALYPLNIVKKPVLLVLIPISLIIFFIIFRKKEKNYKTVLLYLSISIVPYLRYITLLNHSYKHFFFTFRTQFATIMSLILIFYFCMDDKKLNKQVNLKRKNKGEKICHKN